MIHPANARRVLIRLAAENLLVSGEVFESLFGLFHTALIRVVGDDFPEKFRRSIAVDIVLFVKLGRAHTPLRLLGIPLHGSVIIQGGPVKLFVGLSFVEFPQLIRRVRDPVACWVGGQDLLKEDFRPTLVIDIVGSPAPVLISEGAPIKLIGIWAILVGHRPE